MMNTRKPSPMSSKLLSFVSADEPRKKSRSNLKKWPKKKNWRSNKDWDLEG